jgi:uncharacterized protein (TIGR02118 family)
MTIQASAISRRIALAGLLGASVAPAVAAPASAGVAVKHYILIDILPGFDQLALDRWYMTYHAPQTRRAYKAWQRNYVSYRSYLPLAEAKQRFPTLLYGRMTEIQFDSLADFQATRPNNIYGDLATSFTPPPGGWRSNKLYKATVATIPTNPDDLILSKDTPPKELPYLRWLVFYRYPKPVTIEQGDAWMRDVHAKEVARLPGLKRYALYRAVADSVAGQAIEYPRVAEMWFDDYPAWREAFLAPEPRFRPPPWGGTFPFVETLSMFVGENPDVDFINDKRVIP